GQQLGRVHEAVGIEDAPQAEHEIQVGVSVLQRQVLGLVHADAVLAAHAAAECDARVEQLLVGLLRALQLTRLAVVVADQRVQVPVAGDRKSTRLNSSHLGISYAVFCLKKKCYPSLNTFESAATCQLVAGSHYHTFS